MSHSPLIFAKVLDGKGGATVYENFPHIDRHQHTWLHFDAHHPRTIEMIKEVAPGIDVHTLEAMFSRETRPRTLHLDEGTLVVLRGINQNEGQQPEDMVAVRFWITEYLVISTRFRRLKAVMQTAELLDKGLGPKNVGDIFTQIAATMLAYIETNIGQLNEAIDDFEERILEEPNRQFRHDIIDVRKSAILLRRYIAPQKEAINQLRFAEIPWLSPRHQRRLQEALDALTRNIEDLDALRERAQVVKDELMNALSDKLNRNLYLLSVITGIFLPLGFLTGLFGINIGGMPGVDNPHAFGIFAGILAVMVAMQVALFKLFRWF